MENFLSKFKLKRLDVDACVVAKNFVRERDISLAIPMDSRILFHSASNDGLEEECWAENSATISDNCARRKAHYIYRRTPKANENFAHLVRFPALAVIGNCCRIFGQHNILYAMRKVLVVVVSSCTATQGASNREIQR